MDCNDCGAQHDDRYTMDFTDVEPGQYIYWCAVCGPHAHTVNDLLMKYLDENPEQIPILEAELDKAEASLRKYIN